MHTIISCGTADEIIEHNPAIEDTIGVEVPQTAIDELLDKLPDFRRSWQADGLELAELEGFGPVQRFGHQFLAGWGFLLDVLRQRGSLKEYLNDMSEGSQFDG